MDGTESAKAYTSLHSKRFSSRSYKVLSYVGRTTQRRADRIKHVPTRIRKKSNAARKQPPRICKNNKSKINCESAIGQHLVANPECARTYADDNFRIIGQARSAVI